jgi:triosephosphate isomerase
MNLTSDEAAELVREIVQTVGQQMDVEVVVCPPFTALSRVAPLLEGGTVKLGAQNMHRPSAAPLPERFRRKCCVRILPHT